MKIENKKLRQVASFIVCFIAMAVIAVVRDGQVFGHKVRTLPNDSIVKSMNDDVIRHTADGFTVVNTMSLAKDVTGYGGNVPLEIYIKNNRIQRIIALKNHETPDFFNEASRLLSAWNGKTIDQAQQLKVDAVSGATFSSRGVIGNVERGLQYASKHVYEKSFIDKMNLNLETIAGLIVVLMAAIVPLFYHNKTYRTIQMILNAGVLGFWCGTFISYSLMVGYMSNGINLWVSVTPVIMLITAFIYPFFGKKNYYCNHICPCGSLQELLGKTNKRRKWKMKAETVKSLERFRDILWAVLTMMMLLGIGFQWMDYEVFSAFILHSASAVVLVLGVIVVILSVFVPHPYCRFVCPTGTLFKIVQNPKA